MNLIFYGEFFKSTNFVENNLCCNQILNKFAKFPGYGLFDSNFTQLEPDEIPDGNVFIVQLDKTIVITVNNTCYKIPGDMTINEFKQMRQISQAIYNKFNLEMFSDEYFGSDSHYHY
jgi:hypothetical protein